jgi:hypothetical protein
MRWTTDIERARAKALKTIRAAIRLKHSLAADEEIAKKLPEIEAAFDKAVNDGRPFELSPGSVFDAE